MSLESEIQRSFLFNILSSNDEKELDSFIDWDNKNTRMMIKKLGALISCKQNGLLSNTDVKIATDRKLTKSYLSGNVDLDRLKTLLRLELGPDGKSLRDVNELIKLDYATHEELMRYLDSNVKDVSPDLGDGLYADIERASRTIKNFLSSDHSRIATPKVREDLKYVSDGFDKTLDVFYFLPNDTKLITRRSVDKVLQSISDLEYLYREQYGV